MKILVSDLELHEVTGHPRSVICECIEQRRGSCGVQLVNVLACESWRLSHWYALELLKGWSLSGSEVGSDENNFSANDCLYCKQFLYPGCLLALQILLQAFFFWGIEKPFSSRA